jgi:hypothetical protein
MFHSGPYSLYKTAAYFYTRHALSIKIVLYIAAVLNSATGIITIISTNSSALHYRAGHTKSTSLS